MIKHLSHLTLVFLSLFATLSQADQVRYLAKPDDAFAAFASTLRGARNTIDLATFIFEPCHTSTQVLFEILEQKAKAGVKVRLLLDSLQQKSDREQMLANYAAKHGMQVRFYNSGEPNMRMHIKFVVVDGQTYIAGGRNISDEYFAMSMENNYVDRDLMVSGDSARQVTAAFNELWSAKVVKARVGNAAGFAGWPKFCKMDLTAKVDEAWRFLEGRGAGLVNALPERNCPSVSFSADHWDFSYGTYGPAPSDDQSGLQDDYMTAQRLNRKLATKAVLGFIDGARMRLSMENWVYIPVYLLRDAFARARDRRVETRVITNEDMEDGPQFFREAMDYAIKYFSEQHSVGTQKVTLVSSKGSMGQADAFELTPARRIPTFMHGKVIVRDTRDVLVGSFNLDGRSYSTNLESVIQVNGCQALAGDVLPPTDALQKLDAADRAAGLIPKKKEPSLLAKVFARMTLILL